MTQRIFKLTVSIIILYFYSCSDNPTKIEEKSNLAPIASFTISPDSGDTSTNFKFDASTSTDNEDSLSQLQIRWDWDNNGTWDTEYTKLKITNHQFLNEGMKSVALEVKDTEGLSDTSMNQLMVGAITQLEFDWIQTGYFSPDIISLACDQNGDIYAGTYDQGLYKSTDMGNYWVRVRFDPGTYLPNLKRDSTRINTIAINSKGYIYFCTGIASRMGTPGGLYRSIDRGENWQYLECSSFPNDIAFDSDDNIYVAPNISTYPVADGRLLRSYNDGLSWPDTLYNFYLTSVDVNSAGHIYIAATQGLNGRRSIDDGASFQNLGNDPFGLPWVYNFEFGTENQVYVARNGYGVSRSLDDGVTWESINNGLLYNSISEIILDKQGILFAADRGNGISYSTNSGNIWFQNNSGLTNWDVRCIVQDSDGFLYCGTQGGVFRSSITISPILK